MVLVSVGSNGVRTVTGTGRARSRGTQLPPRADGTGRGLSAGLLQEPSLPGPGLQASAPRTGGDAACVIVGHHVCGEFVTAAGAPRRLPGSLSSSYRMTFQSLSPTALEGDLSPVATEGGLGPAATQWFSALRR